MQTFSTKAQLRAALLKHHRKHDHVVLVPTMGALHAGHRALLEQARKLAGEDGVVVASIFVNPIQFNNSSDLQTYPRTPEKDLEVCEGAGVDYVFSPAPEEMYSGERSIAVEESFLSTTLCGASRPGHFSGVCTVLAKLFNLVQPTDAIFGKKDFHSQAPAVCAGRPSGRIYERGSGYRRPGGAGGGGGTVDHGEGGGRKMIAGAEHCGPGGCKLRIAGVSKVFDGRRGKVVALEGINLNIRGGEFVCLVGASEIGRASCRERV